MSTKVDEKDFLITNLKGLLQEKLWLLEQRLQERRVASAYKSLTEAQSKIFAALRGEALTISDIARRLNVSRQAVHKIVSQLVQSGLLKLEPLPDNARDKKIVFTRQGEALKKEAAKVLGQLEKEVEEQIGAKNLVLLSQVCKIQSP